VTLLGKFVRMKVDAELKKMKETLWCKECSGGGCEGACLRQNHKSYRLL
jgi:hypothetical protein